MVNISSRITSAQAIQKSLNLKTKAAISLTDGTFGLKKNIYYSTGQLKKQTINDGGKKT